VHHLDHHSEGEANVPHERFGEPEQEAGRESKVEETKHSGKSKHSPKRHYQVQASQSLVERGQSGLDIKGAPERQVNRHIQRCI